jgi:hypothetical protein
MTTEHIYTHELDGTAIFILFGSEWSSGPCFLFRLLSAAGGGVWLVCEPALGRASPPGMGRATMGAMTAAVKMKITESLIGIMMFNEEM